MFQKLDAVEKRYEELTRLISDPEVISNHNEWQKYVKEHAEITDVVEKYREYKKVEKIISVKRKNWVTKDYDERNCKIDSLETIECWSDISSMEIFVNQGSKVFSMRMFTEEENGKVKISGLMKETVVEMYDLMGEGEEKNE
jgi:sucrose-6-phosphate hydrolase SacC (GH32 family)